MYVCSYVQKNQHIQKERTSGQGVIQEMCVRQGQVKKEETKRFFLHFSPTPSSVAAKLSFHFFPPLTSSRPLNRHVRIYLKDINAKIKDEVLHFKMYVYSSLLTYIAQWQLGGNRVDQTDNHTQAL